MSEDEQNNETTQQVETDWRTTVPETVKSWDEFKNSETQEAFWDQMANHRAMVGRSVQIPTGDASEADREKFFGRMQQHFPEITKAPNYDDPETLQEVRRRMGMPETPDKYNIPDLEIPEESPVNETRVNELRALAHEAGLTQDQYKILMGKVMGDSINSAVEQKRMFNNELAALKSEWGMAFDEKSSQAERIRKEFFDFIPPEAMNASSRRAMARLAQQLGSEGHSLTDTADKAVQHAMTPGEARQRAHEIMSDSKGPYWDIRSPQHKHTKEKYRKLLEIANS